MLYKSNSTPTYQGYNDGATKKHTSMQRHWSLFIPYFAIFLLKFGNLAKYEEPTSWLTIEKVISVIPF